MKQVVQTSPCKWCGHPDAEQHGLSTCAHRIREERDHLKDRVDELTKALKIAKAELEACSERTVFHGVGSGKNWKTICVAIERGQVKGGS